MTNPSSTGESGKLLELAADAIARQRAIRCVEMVGGDPARIKSYTVDGRDREDASAVLAVLSTPSPDLKADNAALVELRKRLSVVTNDMERVATNLVLGADGQARKRGTWSSAKASDMITDWARQIEAALQATEPGGRHD